MVLPHTPPASLGGPDWPFQGETRPGRSVSLFPFCHVISSPDPSRERSVFAEPVRCSKLLGEFLSHVGVGLETGLFSLAFPFPQGFATTYFVKCKVWTGV